jgi:multicomponent Na+:H+ antiporter subunit G
MNLDTLQLILQVISELMIGFGLLVLGGSSVGLFRLPDFYCRMHAAGKADTLSSLAMFSGLALYHIAGNIHHLDMATIFVSLKIFFICIFIAIFSPTATHALVNAGYAAGVKPWTPDSKEAVRDAGDEVVEAADAQAGGAPE